MFLKTNKPILGKTNEENILKLLTYTENLKDEIAFRLDTMSKKIDALYASIKTLQGGE